MATAPTSSKISILNAGDLDRKIQVLGLTITKTKGEARRSYAQILSVPSAKDPQGGTEGVKAGAVTNVGTVIFRIRYNTTIITEPKNYEAMQVGESIDAPVYLLDLSGQIMYDLYGNPLISIIDTTTVLYNILDIQEVGRRVAMDLICERWR